jgi:hypothetical protein
VFSGETTRIPCRAWVRITKERRRHAASASRARHADFRRSSLAILLRFDNALDASKHARQTSRENPEMHDFIRAADVAAAKASSRKAP